MTVLWRRRTERRALTPSTFGGVLSGQPVTQAAGIPAFHAAVRMIADGVAATPIGAVRRDPATGILTPTPRDPSILTPLMSGLRTSWLRQIVVSMCHYGAAYGVFVGSTAGWPDAILWTNPAHWSCDDQILGAPIFRYNGVVMNPGVDFVYVPWMQDPGRVAVCSPVTRFRRAIGTLDAAERAAADFYSSSGPTWTVKTDRQAVSSEQLRQMRDRVEADMRGRRGIALPAGLTIDMVGLPPGDQQWLSQQTAGATQVAAIFGVPPESIGGTTGTSMTYATVAGQRQAFQLDVLYPWLLTIEEALTQCIPRGQEIKFNLYGNVPSDPLVEAQTTEIDLRSGVLTLDEARTARNRAPLTPEQLTYLLARYGGSQGQGATLPAAPPTQTGGTTSGA